MINNIGVIGGRNRGQGAPPTNERWVGSPNTNGVPDSPVGPWTNYTNSADRIYGRKWVATEDGTATHMNLRWADTVNVGTYGAFLCIVKNGDICGQIAIDPDTAGPEAWTGDIAVPAVYGRSLSFVTGDVMVIAMAFDGNGGPHGISQDLTADSTGNQYATVTVIATGPPSDITFSESSANKDAAFIMKYEV